DVSRLNFSIYPASPPFTAQNPSGPPMPPSFPNPSAPPPAQPCQVFIRGVGHPAPAYCCDEPPPQTSPVYPRYISDCPPHDPNFKEADPPVGANGRGLIAAGADIAYTIHYLNDGASDAHGVLIIDPLPGQIDDATLAIEDGGTFDAATRTIVWTDAVVFPMDPRAVHFSARLRADLPPGTLVRNVATIVFPDAVPPT